MADICSSQKVLSFKELQIELHRRHVLEWLADYWTCASKEGRTEAHLDSSLLKDSLEQLTEDDIKYFSSCYRVAPRDLLRHSIATYYEWMTDEPLCEYFRQMMQLQCRRGGGLYTIHLSSFSLYQEELKPNRTLTYEIAFMPP